MAQSAFLLLFGALIIWLFASGKLGQMMQVIKTKAG